MYCQKKDIRVRERRRKKQRSLPQEAGQLKGKVEKEEM